MTPEKPTNPMQKGTPKADQPASQNSDSSSSDEDDNTDDKEYLTCSQEWLGLDSNRKRMLNDVRNMLAHHERTMRKKAVSIFQQAVYQDPKVFIEARAQITAGVYVMHEAIVGFDTWLRNILYFTSGEGK